MKQSIVICLAFLCAVAPLGGDACRSLKAGCWFDSSCCTGLCQGFRCRISEELFKDTETFLNSAQPAQNKRRKVNI